MSSQNDYGTTVECAADAAQKKGYIVHHSEPNVLTVDLDGGAQLNNGALALLTEHYGAKIIGWWRSKDGVGRHFKIRLSQALPLPMRSTMQAALGSDPKREILGMKNWCDAVERGSSETFEPFLLFQPTTESQRYEAEAAKEVF